MLPIRLIHLLIVTSTWCLCVAPPCQWRRAAAAALPVQHIAETSPRSLFRPGQARQVFSRSSFRRTFRSLRPRQRFTFFPLSPALCPRCPPHCPVAPMLDMTSTLALCFGLVKRARCSVDRAPADSVSDSRHPSPPLQEYSRSPGVQSIEFPLRPRLSLRQGSLWTRRRPATWGRRWWGGSCSTGGPTTAGSVALWRGPVRGAPSRMWWPTPGRRRRCAALRTRCSTQPPTAPVGCSSPRPLPPGSSGPCDPAPPDPDLSLVSGSSSFGSEG
jgi:hypothetical protein